MPFPASQVRAQLAHARRTGLDRIVTAAAKRHGVRADVLLAVASRESHMGMMPPLARDWTGDRGHGRGVFQIDDRWHPEFVRAHRNDDHTAHADYAARFLKKLLGQFGGRYDHALAAYNAGPGNVRKALAQKLPAEHYTTGRDYATDVLARARAVVAAGAAPPSSGTLPAGFWPLAATSVGAVSFFLNPGFGALAGVSLGLMALSQNARQGR